MSWAGVKAVFKKPEALFSILGARGYLNWLSDEAYIKMEYRLKMKKKLDLDNPSTFNAKLQWLKLYDRKPEYTTMVDKHAVKQYVAERIGQEYIIPTYGIWDHFDEIDFDSLPNQFVLKCTHDSGGVVVCTDKAKLNRAKSKAKLKKCLKRNYYWQVREWPYKNVRPRIIAEEYMEDKTVRELRDYKFFCFDGQPKALFIATDRQTKGEETKFDFFDMEYNHLDVRNGHPNADVLPEKPKCFNEMKCLAAKLSKGFPQVRVDFYEANGRVYFGEMTLFHWSGLVPFEPEKWDKIFGDWIQLPQ